VGRRATGTSAGAATFNHLPNERHRLDNMNAIAQARHNREERHRTPPVRPLMAPRITMMRL